MRTQPDAVLEHGNGLIAVEFKSGTNKPHPNKNIFSTFVSEAHLLQCLAMAIVVAAKTGKPTAPVLVYKTAVFLLEPELAIIQQMISSFTPARQYYVEKVQTKDGDWRNRVGRYIAAGKLAKYYVARLEFDYPDTSSRSQASSERGQTAHADQFRSDDGDADE